MQSRHGCQLTPLALGFIVLLIYSPPSDSQQFPPCGVDVKSSSADNHSSYFSPKNHLNSLALSQELHTFCHLTAIDPTACLSKLGAFYQANCHPSAPESIFSNAVFTSPQPWQLPNEPSTDAQKNMKSFLKDAVIVKYKYCVEVIMSPSFSLWGKHLGSYLSFPRDIDLSDNTAPQPMGTAEGKRGDMRQQAASEAVKAVVDAEAMAGDVVWDVKSTDDTPTQNVSAYLASVSASSTANELPSDILSDFDTDISSYFQFLSEWCQHVEHEDWYANCYKFLLNLTNVPRCTTTMDSGYCKPPPQHTNPSFSVSSVERKNITSTWVLSQRALLEGALVSSGETLHVVILGAGPVGLITANLLSSLLQHRVRIVVFETRIMHTRRKKLYTREWLTELPLALFNRCPDLKQILANFVRVTYTNLPINILETLLLLSNREKGVTFIYDDYQKYLDILTSFNVDLVFDATGHRLSKFKYPPVVVNYTVQHFEPPHLFSDHIVIAHSQDVHYPVSLNKYDQLFYPYTLYFLKINYLTSEHFQYIRQLERVYEDKACTAYSCGPYFPFKADPPAPILAEYVKHSNEVVTNLVLISLTAEQADLITSYLDYIDDNQPAFTSSISGNESETVTETEYPIYCLPDDMLQETTLQARGLVDLLAYLKQYANSMTTLSRPYRYNPYMYSPTPVPNASHAFDEAMTVLRIGNSLLSGDATASTGMYTQFQLVADIVRHVGQQYYAAFG